MKVRVLLVFALAAAAAIPRAVAQERSAAQRLAERYGPREPAGLTTDQRIAYWDKLLKASPGNTNAMLSLAGAYLQKNRETTDFSYVDRTAGLIDRVFTADPANYGALRLRVEVAMNHHRFPQAIEYTEQLLARNPSDAGLVGLLGDAFMEMGRYDEAEQAYKRMLDLGGNLFSYNRYAYHQFVIGKQAEALAWMAQAVEAGSRQPENEAWCLVEFGDMLFKTGQVELAEKMYRRSLALLPEYHRANAAMGRFEASRGNYAVSIGHFRKAQAAVPFPEYAAALDALYRRDGNIEEADRLRRVVDGIAQIARASGEKANRTLAMIFADDGRNLPEALKLAEAELEVRQDVYTYDALAWVLFRSGRIDEARKAAGKALAFKTPEPLFYYHAGAVALAAGDKEQARSLLERALALNANFDFRHAPGARRLLDELIKP